MAELPDSQQGSIRPSLLLISEGQSREKSYQSQTSDFDDFWHENHSIRQIPAQGRSRVAKSIVQTRKRDSLRPRKGVHDIPPFVNGICQIRDTLQTSNFQELNPGSGQQMQEVSTGFLEYPAYPSLGDGASNTLFSSPKSWRTASLEDPPNPYFEPETSLEVSFEGARSLYHAQPPADTQQPLTTTTYHCDHQGESLQTETPSIDVPPPVDFISWACKQDQLEASPKQLSIWSHILRVPETTVEKWYHQYKIYDPLVEHGRSQTPHLGSTSFLPPRAHRIKCLNGLKQRGRYIDSVGAAARGPYSCTSGCGENWARKADWRRHEDNNYPLEEWTCTICYQRFTRQDKLKSHMGAIHKKNLCPSRFNFRSLPDNYNRQCQYCKARFLKSADFYRHTVERIEHATNSCTSIVQVQDSTPTSNVFERDWPPELEHVGHHDSNGMTTSNEGSLDFQWHYDTSK